MILAFFLWFQTGPCPRTDFVAPTSMTHDYVWAVEKEDLMNHEIYVQLKWKF